MLMQINTIAALVAASLILLRLASELWLAWLNRQHVARHAGEVPAAFQGIIDTPTYSKSVQYTLAKSRFGQIEEIFSTVLLLVVLFSGVLPFAFHWFSNTLGSSAWAMAAFLF